MNFPSRFGSCVYPLALPPNIDRAIREVSHTCNQADVQRQCTCIDRWYRTERDVRVISCGFWLLKVSSALSAVQEQHPKREAWVTVAGYNQVQKFSEAAKIAFMRNPGAKMYWSRGSDKNKIDLSIVDHPSLRWKWGGCQSPQLWIKGGRPFYPNPLGWQIDHPNITMARN